MTYSGRIKGGSVVLDEPVRLPEGAFVEVSVVESGTEARNVPAKPTLLEGLAELDGAADGLPPDLARNHDHYLHGLPKR